MKRKTKVNARYYEYTIFFACFIICIVQLAEVHRSLIFVFLFTLYEVYKQAGNYQNHNHNTVSQRNIILEKENRRLKRQLQETTEQLADRLLSGDSASLLEKLNRLTAHIKKD